MKTFLAGLGILAAAGAAPAASITTVLDTSNAIDAPLNSNPAYASSSYYNYFGEVDGGTLETKVLIRFDLTSLPPSSVINSAKLFIRQYGGNTTQTGTVHAILKDWNNSLTYNLYDGVNAWSTPGLGSGTDYEAASSASVAFNSPGSDIEIDITSQYLQWDNSSEANYGLVLIPTNLDNNYVELAATEPIPPNTEPFGVQLVIDYTVVPEPASMGLVGLAGIGLLARRRG